ncbi:MAG: hypothetical protein AAFV97_01920 [Bacteroidota bacterium]
MGPHHVNPLYAREGHQVHCSAQGDRWVAQVQEHCTPGFARALTLPIYASTAPWGGSTRDTIRHLLGCSPKEQANWVHVVLPEKAAMKQGFVYIGKKAGLCGGRSQGRAQHNPNPNQHLAAQAQHLQNIAQELADMLRWDRYIAKIWSSIFSINTDGQSFRDNLQNTMVGIAALGLICTGIAWSLSEGEQFEQSIQAIAKLCIATFITQCMCVDNLRAVFLKASLRSTHFGTLYACIVRFILDEGARFRSKREIVMLSLVVFAGHFVYAYVRNN